MLEKLIYKYLQNQCSSATIGKQQLVMLEYALDNWHSPNRNRALIILIQEEERIKRARLSLEPGDHQDLFRTVKNDLEAITIFTYSTRQATN